MYLLIFEILILCFEYLEIIILIYYTFNFFLMYKQRVYKQRLLVSTLTVTIISSLVIILTVNPIQNVYSINPTNPTDDVIKGSIQYF
jgi:hypothetical protein